MHDKYDGIMVISNVKNSCTTRHMYCINNCKSVIEQGKMKMVNRKDQCHLDCYMLAKTSELRDACMYNGDSFHCQ